MQYVYDIVVSTILYIKIKIGNNKNRFSMLRKSYVEIFKKFNVNQVRFLLYPDVF